MLLLSIPKPCHENWDEMSPREHGAFCKVCAKTVIDFTMLSDEEVKNYFFQHSGQKTCGRFRDDQLAAPNTLQELLSRPIPFWKKFLAIVCIVFGGFLSSCQIATVGKIKEPLSISVGEPESGYATSGVTLTETRPDTAFIEETVCTTIGTTAITEGIIEPPSVTVGDVGLEIIEEPEKKPDTMIFTGGIKVDSIKKSILFYQHLIL